MKKIDNKGFTLVELIATIVLLSIVLSIGSYSIIKIINNSKNNDYKLLIKNIKDASENYYFECKYGSVDTNLFECNNLTSGFSLGNLVQFGYLTGNGKDNNDKYILVNPNDGKSIVNCNIKITVNNGGINVIAINPSGSCPTSY